MLTIDQTNATSEIKIDMFNAKEKTLMTLLWQKKPKMTGLASIG